MFGYQPLSSVDDQYLRQPKWDRDRANNQFVHQPINSVAQTLQSNSACSRQLLAATDRQCLIDKATTEFLRPTSLQCLIFSHSSPFPLVLSVWFYRTSLSLRLRESQLLWPPLFLCTCAFRVKISNVWADFSQTMIIIPLQTITQP